MAERHSAVRLLDRALPPLRPIAWHERYDPGAPELAALTRSQALGWREHTNRQRRDLQTPLDRRWVIHIHCGLGRAYCGLGRVSQ